MRISGTATGIGRGCAAGTAGPGLAPGEPGALERGKSTRSRSCCPGLGIPADHRAAQRGRLGQLHGQRSLRRQAGCPVVDWQAARRCPGRLSGGPVDAGSRAIGRRTGARACRRRRRAVRLGIKRLRVSVSRKIIHPIPEILHDADGDSAERSGVGAGRIPTGRHDLSSKHARTPV
jgi:hypothetical protein